MIAATVPNHDHSSQQTDTAERLRTTFIASVARKNHDSAGNG